MLEAVAQKIQSAQRPRRRFAQQQKRFAGPSFQMLLAPQQKMPAPLKCFGLRRRRPFAPQQKIVAHQKCFGPTRRRPFAQPQKMPFVL